jgi:uncharacterized membrane protein (UPF0127 family)
MPKIRESADRMRTRTLAALLAIALLPLAAACASTTDAPEFTPPSATTNATSAAGQPPLRTIEAGVNGSTIVLEVADDGDELTRGLSGRDGLDDDAGMLFVWEEPGVRTLWMKETRFPLDFLWLDEERRVVSIEANVPPQPGAPDSELIRYSSGAPVRYAIELDAGMIAALGIAVDDVVEFAEQEAP